MIAWEDVPPEVGMVPETLHLWRARLSDFTGLHGSLATLLSGEEAARAARYRFLEPRERFVAGRAVLRWILSHYVGVAADQLRLAQGANGKPCLAGPEDGSLQFNLAHSDRLILCLVGRDRAVGVDVEMARPIIGMNRLASLLFASDQHLIFDGLSEDVRLPALLSMWTSMEALGKATGLGLAHALKEFRLEVEPARGAAVPAQICCGSSGCYVVRALDLAEEHVGAFAVQVPDGDAPSDIDALAPIPRGYTVNPRDVLGACLV